MRARQLLAGLFVFSGERKGAMRYQAAIIAALPVMVVSASARVNAEANIAATAERRR